jgi:nitrite reductase/ring-hydroxylating ferredoxin subunit
MGVITQRQSVGVPQNEAMIFHCDKCGAETLRRDYGADEFPDRLDGPTDPQIIGLPTISQSSAAAETYNASDAARTCKSCGYVSKAFPTAFWGWDHYRRRTAIAVASRKIMLDVSAQGTHTAGSGAAGAAEAVATTAATTGALRFQPVAKASEIGDGDMKAVTVGAKHIAIYNLGGEYHATDAYCTHGHALLTEGYIDGTTVECPMHGGMFDITSGAPTGAPCTTALATYPVRVDGDTLAIGISGDA